MDALSEWLRIVSPRRLVRAAWHGLRYGIALARRRPAGDFSYFMAPDGAAATLAVEVFVAAEGERPAGREEAVAWCGRQTLRELRVTGFSRQGRPVWRVGRNGELRGEAQGPFWWMAPGSLPELYPAFVESAVLVAAAEDVDAVVLTERLEAPPRVAAAADVLTRAVRPYSLLAATAYRYDAAADAVRPTSGRQLVKLVEDGGETKPRAGERFHRRRRGPYLSVTPLPPLLRVGVRDVARLSREPRPPRRPHVLVSIPFLARGGAEHTLFETLKALRGDFEFTFVTLAPHRRELGDRRKEFHDEISERLYCLGDLVHPAAMPGILISLIRTLGVEILYNASSTTLFYDFGPALKAAHPSLRILDHLYDHRVGYVERYQDGGLLDWIDACVAENRRIAEVLTAERGWPGERVPVIWPCGRPRDAFPRDFEPVRRARRRELDLDDETLVLLTAARMHPQKRPMDLVELARRLRGAPVFFLVVGGGDLEDEVDAAIAAADGAPIRRLAFRTDIPELVVAADVGCLVSEYEGLPVFMIECLQAGRPFLGTDVGDMGDVLRRTGAGLVVDRPGDLDGLAAAVRKLLDPAIRSRLAERTAAAAAELDVETCARRYAAAFGGVTAKASQQYGTP